MSFTFGPFIVALITNSYGTLDSVWAYRGIFVAQYGITFLAIIALPFMPESPYWLISHGKEEKAVRSYRRLGQSPAEIEKSLANVKLTLEKIRKETEGVTYAECFRKSNLRRTMIAIAPLSIQALCGVYFVAVYSTYYAQLAGYSTQMSYKLTIIAQVLSICGNMTSWFLVDRVGRRPLTFYGLVILTVLLFVIGGLGVADTPGAIKGTVSLLMIYAYFYNASIGATAYTALAEIATGRLRAKTASIGLALQNALFSKFDVAHPDLIETY